MTIYGVEHNNMSRLIRLKKEVIKGSAKVIILEMPALFESQARPGLAGQYRPKFPLKQLQGQSLSYYVKDYLEHRKLFSINKAQKMVYYLDNGQLLPHDFASLIYAEAALPAPQRSHKFVLADLTLQQQLESIAGQYDLATLRKGFQHAKACFQV